jgi:hypothetical protein
MWHIGQRVRIEGMDESYLVAQVGHQSHCCLVGVTYGNRLTDPITVGDPAHILTAEMNQMAGTRSWTLITCSESWVDVTREACWRIETDGSITVIHAGRVATRRAGYRLAGVVGQPWTFRVEKRVQGL